MFGFSLFGGQAIASLHIFRRLGRAGIASVLLTHGGDTVLTNRSKVTIMRTKGI